MNRVFDRSLALRAFSSQTARRTVRPPPLGRPGPLPLPAKEQREFEELVKRAAGTTDVTGSMAIDAPARDIDKDIHPDARRGLVPEFAGDVNPITGEQGGPKREPVRPNSDWSFGGRVTDF